MGLWVCGDIHGAHDIGKLNMNSFPAQKNMSKDDFLIILGDFGLVWDYRGESKEEKYWLEWLNNKNFTTLFVDGNHEAFSRLNTSYLEIEFHGGRAHQIRENVYHLIRGYVFELSNQKCFVMGGAKSHDIQDGIIDPANWKDGIYDTGFKKTVARLNKERKLFRVKGTEWWPEEMPSAKELIRGIENLKKDNNKVDFIFTHCAPTSVISQMGYHDRDTLTEYFNRLSFTIEYKEWHFGHYHEDRKIAPNFYCHYRNAPWRLA